MVGGTRREHLPAVRVIAVDARLDPAEQAAEVPGGPIGAQPPRDCAVSGSPLVHQRPFQVAEQQREVVVVAVGVAE
jgi:hypothetical protein